MTAIVSAGVIHDGRLLSFESTASVLTVDTRIRYVARYGDESRTESITVPLGTVSPSHEDLVSIVGLPGTDVTILSVTPLHTYAA